MINQLFLMEQSNGKLSISTSNENSIAQIDYSKGEWVLTPLHNNKVQLNNAIVKSPIRLDKTSILSTKSHKVHWIDYCPLPPNQDIYLKDLFSIRGRINKANFKMLCLFFLGLAIIIYFLPGLIATLLDVSTRTGSIHLEFYSLMSIIAKPIWIILYSALIYSWIIITIKRFRNKEI